MNLSGPWQRFCSAQASSNLLHLTLIIFATRLTGSLQIGVTPMRQLKCCIMMLQRWQFKVMSCCRWGQATEEALVKPLETEVQTEHRSVLEGGQSEQDAAPLTCGSAGV